MAEKEAVNGPIWPDDPDGVLTADAERVYGEYHAAREAYEKSDPGSRAHAVVVSRFNQAQVALREHRRAVREMQSLEADLRGEPLAFVRVENNAEPPPVDTLRHVDGEPWTERRHHPRGS